jgi:hypothetical protein
MCWDGVTAYLLRLIFEWYELVDDESFAALRYKGDKELVWFDAKQIKKWTKKLLATHYRPDVLPYEPGDDDNGFAVIRSKTSEQRVNIKKVLLRNDRYVTCSENDIK